MIKFSLSSEKIQNAKCDLIVLPLLEGKIEKNSSTDLVDQHLARLISETIKKEEFKGKVGEIKILHTHYKIKAPYIAIVGLGESKKFTLESLRRI